MPVTAHRPIVLICALAAASCGKDAPAPIPKEAADSASAGSTPARPGVESAGDAAPAPPTAATTGADPFSDSDGWDTEDNGNESGSGTGSPGDLAGTSGGEIAAPTGHLGPCSITWSTGTKITFAYDGKTSGTMEVDVDSDGTPDVCGSFALTDGRPTKIEVDDGCDKKADVVITPKYVAGQNLATATVRDKASGKKTKLTLVSLPSFTGVMPGYPLQSAKRDIGLTLRDGLIRTANVNKPNEGPALKASFYYDKFGRIKTVKETFDASGSVQRYDYRYDKAGNISRIRLAQSTGERTVKSTAKLNYSCWK